MTGCFAVCLAIVGCVRPPPNSLALDQDKAGTEGEESEQHRVPGSRQLSTCILSVQEK